MGLETLAAIGGIIGTAATVGTTVAGAFQKPPSMPKIPKMADASEVDAQLRAAEKQRRLQASLSKGRGGTILTSPLGLMDSTSTQSLLLGG